MGGGCGGRDGVGGDGDGDGDGGVKTKVISGSRRGGEGSRGLCEMVVCVCTTRSPTDPTCQLGLHARPENISASTLNSGRIRSWDGKYFTALFPSETLIEGTVWVELPQIFSSVLCCEKLNKADKTVCLAVSFKLSQLLDGS